MTITIRSLAVAVPPAFIAYFLFIHTPLVLFWGSLESITSPALSLLPVFLLFSTALFFLLLFPLLVRIQGFRARYLSFLIILSVMIWSTASFLMGKHGVLAGFGLKIDGASLSAKIEVLVWVLALMTSILLYRPIIRVGLQFVAGIFALSIALLIFDAFYYGNRDIGFRDTGFSERFLTFSERGNVLHIVLDELQSTVLKSYLEDQESLEASFDGFTLFEDAVANYSSTLVSIPSMLSGSLYWNDADVYDYAGEAIDNSVFLMSLRERGFSLDLHTIPELCNRITDVACTAIPSGTHLSTALLFMDLSLFRSVPTAVKPLLVKETTWLISGTILKDGHASSRYGLAPSLFKKFVDGVVVEDVPPSYKFFHSLITHSPQVLDPNCRMKVEIDDASLESRKAELQCALRHISSLLEKLKSLGVYDQTLILISSDHGSNLVAGLSSYVSNGRKISPLHRARAMAPLLVKPIDSRGGVKVSSAQVSMLDVPNTVLEALAIPAIDVGTDVFSVLETQSRERNFFYYNWLFGAAKNNRLSGFVGYRIFGDADNPVAWKHLAPASSEQE